MPRISGTVPGLDPETTYDFQVRVVNAFGVPGDWSNVAQGTTLAAGDPVGMVVRLYGPEVSGSIRTGITFVTPNIGEFGYGSAEDFDLPPDGFTTGDFPEDYYGNHILHQSDSVGAVLGTHGDLFYINLDAVTSRNPGLTSVVFDVTSVTLSTSSSVDWGVWLHGGGTLTIGDFGAHMWEKYGLEPGIYATPDQMLYRSDGLVDVLDSVEGTATVSTTPTTWRITVNLNDKTVTQS